MVCHRRDRGRGEALVLLPQGMVMFVGQARLPKGAEVTPDHEHDAFAWWPRDIGEWRAGRLRGAPSDGPLALPVSGAQSRSEPSAVFNALKWTSFTHSCVYLSLLVCAFAAGEPQPATFILGLSHGLLWIFMSLACITAARLRIVSLRLAVAVAVLGGIRAVLRELRVHPRTAFASATLSL